MKDETILCLRTDEVQAVLDRYGIGDGFTPKSVDFGDIECHWLPRTEELENNEDYLQPIPYVIFDSENGRWPLKRIEYLSYLRIKGGEHRLDGQRSLGIGGHVNPGDITGNKAIASCMRAAFREVREELGIRPQCGLHYRGIIRDRSNAVGRVHLGVVIGASLTGLGFTPAPEIGAPQWHPIHAYRDMPLESWSRLIVDYYCGGKA